MQVRELAPHFHFDTSHWTLFACSYKGPRAWETFLAPDVGPFELYKVLDFLPLQLGFLQIISEMHLA